MSQHDERIDAYIATSAEFARPILTHLRGVVHTACPEAEETLKWGMPSFTYRGKLLCGMAAFQQHASFNLWHGERIVGDDAQREDGMGQFGRLTRVADLPGKRELSGYVKEAMKLIDAGVKRTVKHDKSRTPLAVPPDLAAALQRNSVADRVFEAFAPSHRRDYIEWIVQAKREDTRAKRLAQAVEWIAEGKTRNWKYQR